MLQMTKAGVVRLAKLEFSHEVLKCAPSGEIGWQLFLLRIARILTETENDSRVSDAEIMDFIKENAAMFSELRSAAHNAFLMLDAGKEVH